MRFNVLRNFHTVCTSIVGIRVPSGMERTLGNEFPVPLLKLSRNRDRETAKSFILSELIKSVGINFLPAVLIGDRKQFFLVSRQVLYFKKNHVRLRTDSILQCLFLRFSTCCYRVIYRSLGGKTTTKRAMQFYLSESIVKFYRKND